MTGQALAEDYGQFLDEVIAKFLDDGRLMELMSDVRFKAPDGVIWKAVQGAKIDGASIPKAFWSIIGGPFEGPYRNASVIHDYYCDTHEKDWRSTHKVFYFGMRAKGVSEVKAKTMYYAVYAFGPRWEKQKDALAYLTLGHVVAETRVGISDRERDSVMKIETRLKSGEDLPLEELERAAEQDRGAATLLPVITHRQYFQ